MSGTPNESSILTLPDDRVDEFLAFGAHAYPNRDYAQHFVRYVKNNPLQAENQETKILIATMNGLLVGQYVLSPFNYWFCGEQARGFWGWDYYFEPRFRHSGLGGLLAMRAIRGYQPYFAMDPNQEALDIHLALKTRIIGRLRQYLWLRGFAGVLAAGWARMQPASMDTTVLPTPIRATFPEDVHGKSMRWVRSEDMSKWRFSPWRPQAIEWERSAKFLTWRFLQEPEKYAIYFLDHMTGRFYFVVRRHRWKGLNVILLVDYRGPFTDGPVFASMLAACKNIARALRYHGVLTMSSHVFFDRWLGKSRFKRFRGESREFPIFSNAKLGEGTSGTRRELFATIADSDLEWSLHVNRSTGGAGGDIEVPAHV